MIAVVGPMAICRLDAPLLERVRLGDRLGALAWEAALWMVVGAAVYGFVFGFWRSPLQAAYAGAKLPLLLSALVASTAAANAVFAKLLGTRLDALQILCCSLLAMATLAILMASLAPISLLLATSLPRHGETLVGARGAAIATALEHAQLLLAFHVALIAAAGITCLRRLRTLLEALLDSPALAARLFWLCFAVEALAGTQLSWMLRPYLGKPMLPVEFLRASAFQGSFFEEVARWVGA